jgi:glycerol-3-phosphate dehydrogenase (NAD(P)+)
VLLARGLAEATELGAALGAEAETFRGPAGVADLLVTSGDEAGIGFRFGRRVGAGEHLAAVRRDQGARTEALPTIAGFSVLAGRSRLRLPTWTALHEVLVAGADPRATIDRCLRAAD